MGPFTLPPTPLHTLHDQENKWLCGDVVNGLQRDSFALSVLCDHLDVCVRLFVCAAWVLTAAHDLHYGFAC